MRSKPSIGQLLIIEENLILVRQGFSSIHFLLESYCNNKAF